MKYNVIFDPKAKLDLKEIFLYVAMKDDLSSANKLLNEIEKACYNLEEYPKRGHIPFELLSTGIKRYLEVHFKQYRIIYEIYQDTVYVHFVLDGRRNIQEILSDRLLR